MSDAPNARSALSDIEEPAGGLRLFLKKISSEEAAAARKAKYEASREVREQRKREEALEKERRGKEKRAWEADRKRKYRAKRKVEQEMGVNIVLGGTDPIVIDDDDASEMCCECVYMVCLYWMRFDFVVISGKRGCYDRQIYECRDRLRRNPCGRRNDGRSYRRRFDGRQGDVS